MSSIPVRCVLLISTMFTSRDFPHPSSFPSSFRRKCCCFFFLFHQGVSFEKSFISFIRRKLTEAFIHEQNKSLTEKIYLPNLMHTSCLISLKHSFFSFFPLSFFLFNRSEASKLLARGKSLIRLTVDKERFPI